MLSRVWSYVFFLPSLCTLLQFWGNHSLPICHSNNVPVKSEKYCKILLELLYSQAQGSSTAPVAFLCWHTAQQSVSKQFQAVYTIRIRPIKQSLSCRLQQWTSSITLCIPRSLRKKTTQRWVLISQTSRAWLTCPCPLPSATGLANLTPNTIGSGLCQSLPVNLTILNAIRSECCQSLFDIKNHSSMFFQTWSKTSTFRISVRGQQQHL